MQMIAVFLTLAALAAVIPFAGGQYTPSRISPIDTKADIVAAQGEAFARAAARVAPSVGPGWIDRSAMTLPMGFTDAASAPWRAWSDGSFVYVWCDDVDPGISRINFIFPAAAPNSGVDVGLADPTTIRWRDGSLSSRPAPVTAGGTVIRIAIA